MGLLDWSPVPARNGTADPTIPAASGGAAKDLMRASQGIMAGVRRFADAQGGALVTGGSLNAYTLETGLGIAELRPGIGLVVRADRTNTAEATLNADGLGPLPWVDAAGVRLLAGRILEGRFYQTILDFADDGTAAWRLQAGSTTLDEIPGLNDLQDDVTAKAAAAISAATSATSDAQTATAKAAAVETARAQVATNTSAVAADRAQTAQDRTATAASATAAASAQAATATLRAQAQAAVATGRVAYDTLAQLQANTSPDVGAVGEVSTGPDAGTYELKLVGGVKTWSLKSRDTLPAVALAGRALAGSLALPGRLYSAARTDPRGYAIALEYAAAGPTIPGRVYARIVTDPLGYATSLTYVGAGETIPGALYRTVTTDPVGYAVDFTLIPQPAPPYPVGPGFLPGVIYSSVTTDPAGYATSAVRVDGRPMRPMPSFASATFGLIDYGQSLSRGLGGNPPITTTAVAGGWRFVGGVRADDGGGTEAQNHASLVPLIETYNGPSKDEGETPCSGMAAALAQIMGANEGAPQNSGQRILVSAPGQGGLQVSALQRGSVPFTRLAADIRFGVALGAPYSLPAMAWVQGESDYVVGTSYADYQARLRQLRADVESEHARATGSWERVVCVSYQVGTHDRYGVPPTIALAQLDLGLTDEDFVVACPMYIMDYQPDVHLRALGSKRLGVYLGKAIYALKQGKRFRPLHALWARAQSATVLVKFHVPVGPLVRETSFITDPNGSWGFEVFDPATGANRTISSVSIVGPDMVSLTLSSAVTPGCRFRAAYTPPAGYVPAGTGNSDAPGATPNGRNVGARCQLRDSDPFVFEPGGLALPTQNYLVITDMEIK